MRYVFDNIGNRTSSYEDATSKTYDANSLNQYTGIYISGGSNSYPLYDDDGNMTQFDSSTYTYDAENRLISAVNGTKRVECGYDALSRRVFKKVYLNNTLSKHERYVYDGMKLLATYNAKSSFAKINSFLWQPFGLDVPLIMSYNSTVYGYLVDANKNVLGLFNPSKTRVATYLYGPFGQKLSESGTIAANNPLQFSSEQFDTDLDLIYYALRYLFPAIGRWLTKDPIGERGGWNLYAFCRNNAVNTWDRWGKEEALKLESNTVYIIIGHNTEIKDIVENNTPRKNTQVFAISCWIDMREDPNAFLRKNHFQDEHYEKTISILSTTIYNPQKDEVGILTEYQDYIKRIIDYANEEESKEEKFEDIAYQIYSAAFESAKQLYRKNGQCQNDVTIKVVILTHDDLIRNGGFSKPDDFFINVMKSKNYKKDNRLIVPIEYFDKIDSEAIFVIKKSVKKEKKDNF
jgi:RHS repeat-associated protein